MVELRNVVDLHRKSNRRAFNSDSAPRCVTITRNCAGITSSRSSANHMHRRPAAGVVGVFRLDRHIHARKTGVKRTAIGAALSGTRSCGHRVFPVVVGSLHGISLLDIFERQKQLLGIQFLRTPAKLTRAATGARDAADFNLRQRRSRSRLSTNTLRPQGGSLLSFYVHHPNTAAQQEKQQNICGVPERNRPCDQKKRRHANQKARSIRD